MGRLLRILAGFAAPVLLLTACGGSAAPGQPIAYSHKVHVTDHGLDCLYCHSSANKAAEANLPSVEKCLSCHRVIAVESPEIRKLAQYWKERKPIPWVRVTALPDHSYFPHQLMVNAGIPCLKCHPGMDRAAGAVQKQEFSMGWCMKCHRERGVNMDCWTCHY